MEQKTSEKQNNTRTESLLMELYKEKEVPKEFLERKFTDNERMTLQRGGTIHWKQMDIGDKKKLDFNVKMHSYVNGKGVVQNGLTVEYKAPKLKIPDKILDQKLNKEEKTALEKGNFFCLERNNKKFLIKVDPNINKVVIRVPAELEMRETMGGYTFGKDELARLANGQQVGPKVYHSPKHGHFMANLSIRQEGHSTEYTYSNVLSFSETAAEKLIPHLNNVKGVVLDDELSKILDTIGLDERQKETLKEAVKEGKGIDPEKKPLEIVRNERSQKNERVFDKRKKTLVSPLVKPIPGKAR